MWLLIYGKEKAELVVSFKIKIFAKSFKGLAVLLSYSTTLLIMFHFISKVRYRHF